MNKIIKSRFIVCGTSLGTNINDMVCAGDDGRRLAYYNISENFYHYWNLK